MITILGAFTDIFINPLAAALVVALGFLLNLRWQVRAGAAVVGILAALPEAAAALGFLDAAANLMGGVIATLLQAEIVLHFVMPAWHFGMALLAAAWELAWGLLGMLLPGRDRAKPEEPSAPPGNPDL